MKGVRRARRLTTSQPRKPARDGARRSWEGPRRARPGNKKRAGDGFVPGSCCESLLRGGLAVLVAVAVAPAAAVAAVVGRAAAARAARAAVHPGSAAASAAVAALPAALTATAAAAEAAGPAA